ncbi:Uncharacterised protein [Actinomyces viscosus]|uniref:Uncharacterized protein n=1 Tax=Actinomyces viscosus TaxID=1656 RepID=A0A448PMT2_ACTVI|nr:Uncharacterised protein [Actinomyces viscosus]
MVNAQFRARALSRAESADVHEGGAELDRRGAYRTVFRHAAQPVSQMS